MALDKATPETVKVGQWAYDVSRLGNQAAIVFINPCGKPGSGKTVLARLLQAGGSPPRPSP